MLSTLIVMAGCSTSSKDERSDGRLLDDKHITSKVEDALKKEPAYKFTNVRVDTFAGIVQLSGFVNTDAQKSRAEAIARDASGVKGVANGLTLKPITIVEPTGRTNGAPRIYAEPENPVLNQQPSNTGPSSPPQPK
jgi:hyperosmotically inducible protein